MDLLRGVPDVSLPRVAAVEKLQNAMWQMPQVELETEHFNADKMYCRVVHRPADTTIVGRVHKKEHFYILAQGHILVTDGNSPAKEYKGFAVIVSQPGTKRAVYAVEDSICLTVHRTRKTKLEEIEKDLVHEEPGCPFLVGNKLRLLK